MTLAKVYSGGHRKESIETGERDQLMPRGREESDGKLIDKRGDAPEHL